jgi:tRNA-modifying protein YgfZ
MFEGADLPDPVVATDAVEEGYRLLREEAALISLADSAVVELRGEDRKGWLHGQATNNLRSLQPGGSIAFCICSPTGQLLAPCELWALEDRYLIQTPRVALPNLLERCESMIIMEDVQFADVTDRYRRLGLQGPQASRLLGSAFPLPNLDAGEAQGVTLLRSNRTGLGGWDLLFEDAGAAEEFARAAPPVSEEAVEIARLEAGIPRMGVDMNERTLPPEMGPHFETRHISYNKGCYTGQEVLMRMHSRGHPNRTWMGVIADEPLTPGLPIRHRSREEAGTITSAADSPQFGYIGAAMIRREAAFEGEEVEVLAPTGPIPAELRHMPLLRF